MKYPPRIILSPDRPQQGDIWQYNSKTFKDFQKTIFLVRLLAEGRRWQVWDLQKQKMSIQGNHFSVYWTLISRLDSETP